MQKYTYYNKNLLRELLPQVIVNDVVTMIDEQLHLPVRKHLEKRIPEIVKDVINSRYINSEYINFVLEEYLKNFYEAFGYSIKNYALDMNEIYDANDFWDNYNLDNTSNKCLFEGPYASQDMFGEEDELICKCIELVGQQEGLPSDVGKYINEEVYK